MGVRGLWEDIGSAVRRSPGDWSEKDLKGKGDDLVDKVCAIHSVD